MRQFFFRSTPSAATTPWHRDVTEQQAECGPGGRRARHGPFPEHTAPDHHRPGPSGPRLTPAG